MAHRGTPNQFPSAEPSAVATRTQPPAFGKRTAGQLRESIASRFLNWLFKPIVIRRLRDVRRTAFLACKEAQLRGDDRDVGRARRALYLATMELLRARG